MAVVTGDRYLEKLEKFVEGQAGALIDGTLVLKLNPAGLHYVQSRLEALHELENLLSGAPVDYLRAYVSDLGDHRALEQLRRILRLLTSLKVVSVLPPPIRDPTPLSLLPFGRLRILELRGCDLSTSAAKGLLELRHTLEKIICHNSADALRHVFASRIAEIKESPQWNRLSFVSCACNRLLLMDESLQLLPAIETLDLSRNRFAKVDNLQRCAKLKHLDLGFNHLRSIASFSEVSCQIVKLVLRNNALTTLRGLENLKSLEALDVSYNIVSNFLELEFLSVLPALKSLWLEGNPLCSARWYRAQVFSYFARPDGMKLDDKEMSTREYWKRRIIIASRQKQPASFGFYSPAKSNAGREGNMCRNKRRKVSRLASIESEEESAYFSSDQESQSIDNELRSKDENIISDDEPEILDLINRVEHMKKERSIHWLREFKEWMDHESEVSEDGSTYCGPAMHQVKENHLKSRSSHKLLSKNSGHASDSLQVYGDETNGNKFVADSSLNDGSSSSNSAAALPRIGRVNLMQKHEKAYSLEELHASFPNTFAVQGDHEVEKGSISLLPTIDDTTESHSSSANPGSPPHYQEDILHRRHNLVEEFLQLSAESYSVASSDSDTSSGEDDFCRVKHEADHSGNEDRHLWNEECSHLGHLSSNNYYRGHETHNMRERPQWDLHTEQASPMEKLLDMNRNDLPSVYGKAEVNHSVSQWPDCVEKMKSKRKIRRVDSLIETMGNNKKGTLENSNGNIYTCEENVERERGECIGGKHKEVSVKGLHWSNVNINSGTAGAGGFPDEFIEEYFNANVADSGTDESCRHYMRCDCLLEPPFSNSEREVALVLSNVNKLYILLIDMEFDESGSILSLLAWHKVEDVREVMFGLGLQVVRVYIEGGTTYMFLTRSIEKSKQLLYTLQVDGPRATNDKCLVRTLELVQVALFQKQIFGDSKLSIFQYSTVLFLHSKDKSWLSRSLFVSGCHVLICAEDLKKFSSPSMGESLPPYFSIDSCCSISDISELIIDARETQCVTLAIQHAAKECNIRCKACKDFAVVEGDNAVSGFLSWTLKWFSEDSLFNFVALLKAIHAFSPLRVTRVS